MLRSSSAIARARGSALAPLEMLSSSSSDEDEFDSAADVERREGSGSLPSDSLAGQSAGSDQRRSPRTRAALAAATGKSVANPPSPSSAFNLFRRAHAYYDLQPLPARMPREQESNKRMRRLSISEDGSENNNSTMDLSPSPSVPSPEQNCEMLQVAKLPIAASRISPSSVGAVDVAVPAQFEEGERILVEPKVTRSRNTWSRVRLRVRKASGTGRGQTHVDVGVGVDDERSPPRPSLLGGPSTINQSGVAVLPKIQVRKRRR